MRKRRTWLTKNPPTHSPEVYFTLVISICGAGSTKIPIEKTIQMLSQPSAWKIQYRAGPINGPANISAPPSVLDLNVVDCFKANNYSHEIRSQQPRLQIFTRLGEATCPETARQPRAQRAEGSLPDFFRQRPDYVAGQT